MEIINMNLIILIFVLILVIFNKILKLQSKIYINKSQNIDQSIDFRYRLNLLEADIKSIERINEIICQKFEKMEKKTKINNPLLDYKNDLLNSLNFKQARIKNVGNFKIWYSEMEGRIFNVAEDTISIEQDENLYITSEGLHIHKEHVELI
jgi:hypothetical protein